METGSNRSAGFCGRILKRRSQRGSLKTNGAGSQRWAATHTSEHRRALREADADSDANAEESSRKRGRRGGGRAKNEMAAQSSLSTERVQQQSHLSVSVERLGTKSRGGGSRGQVVSQIGQQRRLANDSPEIVAAPCTRRSRHGRL